MDARRMTLCVQVDVDEHVERISRKIRHAVMRCLHSLFQFHLEYVLARDGFAIDVMRCVLR